MTSAILFDLDGTLFDRDATVRALVEEQWRVFADQLAHVPACTYVERVLALDAHGYGDKAAVYRQVVAELGLAGGMDAALTEHFWSNYQAHGRLFPEVVDALAALRVHDCQLGIITNGTVAVQEPVIARLGLEPLMDVVLISEREGVRKPAAEIFARALDALDTPATQAWFVGDHPETDVAAAAAAGLAAVWRRNACWPPPMGPHHAIDGIDDVLPLLHMGARRVE